MLGSQPIKITPTLTPAQKCQHGNREAENSKHTTSLASSTNQKKLSGLKIIQVCSKIYLELGKKNYWTGRS